MIVHGVAHEEIMFWEFPLSGAYRPRLENTRMGRVTISNGTMSIPQIIAQLQWIVPNDQYQWDVQLVEENVYRVNFPSKMDLVRAQHFGSYTDPATRISMSFDFWRRDILPAWEIEKVWVRVHDLPSHALDDFLGLWAIGELFGKTMDVDMAFTRRNDVLRINIACLDPSFIASRLDVLIKDGFYKLRFEVERAPLDTVQEVVMEDAHDQDGDKPQEDADMGNNHQGREAKKNKNAESTSEVAPGSSQQNYGGQTNMLRFGDFVNGMLVTSSKLNWADMVEEDERNDVIKQRLECAFDQPNEVTECTFFSTNTLPSLDSVELLTPNAMASGGSTILSLAAVPSTPSGADVQVAQSTARVTAGPPCMPERQTAIGCSSPVAGSGPELLPATPCAGLAARSMSAGTDGLRASLPVQRAGAAARSAANGRPTPLAASAGTCPLGPMAAGPDGQTELERSTEDSCLLLPEQPGLSTVSLGNTCDDVMASSNSDNAERYIPANVQEPNDLDKIIAFGGIPPSNNTGVRSSGRIRAQPNADATQMERAVLNAQRRDMLQGLGKNLYSELSVLNFSESEIISRAEKMRVSLGSNENMTFSSANMIKECELRRTLTMLKKVEATTDIDVANQNDLVVSRMSSLCDDLVEDDEHPDHISPEQVLLPVEQQKRGRPRKKYDATPIRRSTRVRTKKTFK
jgi:hypothetical protein